MGNAVIYSFDKDERGNQLALDADLALARLAAAGDREAFKTIVDGNKQRMFTVARSVLKESELAEDAVQEAFIKAYRALADFKGQSRLSTWLHRITYLTAIDLQRQRSRHLRLADSSFEEESSADTSAQAASESSAESQRLQRDIDQALECLSAFELTVFTLRHMQNFKLREIAVVVDRSEGTVKNILFRAIRKMRDELSAHQITLQEYEQC
ncbi:MAG: RNA polymerase sigma factor [Pseudomonadales bacterium]|nr:RNA polymerase sigma factor [Pseudomonadales bacterium]